MGPGLVVMFMGQGRDTGSSPSSCASSGVPELEQRLGEQREGGEKGNPVEKVCRIGGLGNPMEKVCRIGGLGSFGGSGAAASAGALEIAFHGRAGWDTDSSTGRSARR